MPARQCPFCGKTISGLHSQCPFCREAVAPVPVPQVGIHLAGSREGSSGNRKIRQGLLYMLLAAVVQYLAGRYGASVLHVPAHIQPLLTFYLVPLLFAGGLGLSIYGFFLHAKPQS